MEGVSGTDGARGLGAGEGSVLMDRVGRRFARRRFEVGGRSEGDAFTARERPVGLLRVGGRKEGDPPLVDMAISGLPTCQCTAFNALYSVLHVGG